MVGGALAVLLLAAFAKPLFHWGTWLAGGITSEYRRNFNPIVRTLGYQHFHVVASRKLIFCAIEKNANSAFDDLLCSLSHAPAESGVLQPLRRWLAVHLRTWADFELGCAWMSTYFAYQGLGIAQLSRAMRHLDEREGEPGWHSFVFVRDPLERFLSGYLSKCVPGHDVDHDVCEEVFGAYPISFAAAVAVVNASGDRFALVPGRPNNHFRLQSTFCNGSVGRAEFDHTIKLERATSRQRVAEMLRAVGVHNPSRQVPAFDYHFPAIATAGKAGGGTFDHITHAEQQRARYLSDPAHVLVLLKHYAPDYRKLPGVSLPRWAIEKVGAERVRQLGLPANG